MNKIMLMAYVIVLGTVLIANCGIFGGILLTIVALGATIAITSLYRKKGITIAIKVNAILISLLLIFIISKGIGIGWAILLVAITLPIITVATWNKVGRRFILWIKGMNKKKYPTIFQGALTTSLAILCLTFLFSIGIGKEEKLSHSSPTRVAYEETTTHMPQEETTTKPQEETTTKPQEETTKKKKKQPKKEEETTSPKEESSSSEEEEKITIYPGYDEYGNTVNPYNPPETVTVDEGDLEEERSKVAITDGSDGVKDTEVRTTTHVDGTPEVPTTRPQQQPTKVVAAPDSPSKVTSRVDRPSNPFEGTTTKPQETTGKPQEPTKKPQEETTSIVELPTIDTDLSASVSISYTRGSKVANVVITVNNDCTPVVKCNWVGKGDAKSTLRLNPDGTVSVKVSVPDNWRERLEVTVYDGATETEIGYKNKLIDNKSY